MHKRLRMCTLGMLVLGLAGIALAAPPSSVPQATKIKPEVAQGLKPVNSQAILQNVAPQPVPGNQPLPSPATGTAVKNTPALPRINPNAVKPGTIPPIETRANTMEINKELPRTPGPDSLPPPRPTGGTPDRFQSVKPNLAAPIAVSDRPANLGEASPATAKRPELGQAVDQAATLGAARDAELIRNEMNALDGLGAGDLDLDLNDAGGPAIANGTDADLNKLRELQPGGDLGGLGSAESFNAYLGDPNHGPNQPGQNGPGGAVSAPNPNSFGVDGLAIVSDGASKPGAGASGGPVGGAGGAGSAGGAAAGSAQRTEPNRSTPGTTQSTDPATGSTTTKTRGADGSTTVTMTFPGEQDNQGSTQTVRYDSQGNPVAVQNSGSGYGGISTGDSYVRNADGTWTHTSASSEDGGHTWAASGPETLYRAPAIAGPRQGGASNVDPDSQQGGGGAVGLGEKHKDPKMVEAHNRGVGPGVRPDENQTVGGAPRLNVDLGGTVVNPPPGEQQGGGPAHQGFNPSSTMDDDFGPRTP
jgi:hypothetical protein